MYARKRFNILSYEGNSGGGGHSKPDMPSGKASKGTYLNRGVAVVAEYGRAAEWKYGTSAGAEPGWRPNYGDWADWVKGYGKLKGISVASDGTVWGVGPNNEIYRRKAAAKCAVELLKPIVDCIQSLIDEGALQLNSAI